MSPLYDIEDTEHVLSSLILDIWNYTDVVPTYTIMYVWKYACLQESVHNRESRHALKTSTLCYLYPH